MVVKNYHICLMKEYVHRSPLQVRLEDYAMGRTLVGGV